MEKIVDLIFQLSRCENGSLESFSVESNTYIEFCGILSYEKFNFFLDQLKKFDQNEITILTNDMDFSEYDSNVDLTFEAIINSKEEWTPKHIPYD